MSFMAGPPTHPSARARLRVGLWALLALGAVGCAGAPPPPVLVAGPGQSLEQLSAGRSLFTNHCQGCHALPEPGQLAPGSWPAEVAGMGRKSGLSVPELSLVADYLVAASRASHGPSTTLVATNRPTH
jgi:mono/diheme cytochrome c family protein